MVVSVQPQSAAMILHLMMAVTTLTHTAVTQVYLSMNKNQTSNPQENQVNKKTE